MMQIILSALIVSASPSLVPLSFPWGDGMNLKGASSVDALAIVRPLRRIGTVRRSLEVSDHRAEGSYFIDEVEVVSSINQRPGTRVRLVIPVGMGDPSSTTELDRNSRYLVLAMRPKNGKLPFPEASLGFSQNYAGRTLGTAGNELQVRSGGSNEVACLAAFKTPGNTLESGTSAERLLGSLVDCLPSSKGDDNARITHFLMTTTPIEIQETNPFISFEDSVPTMRIRRFAASLPPVERARALGILVNWRIRGSESPFIDALALASHEPVANLDEALMVNLSFVPIGTRFAPAGYQAPTLSPDRWAGIVVSARNESLRHFFLSRFGGRPSEANQKKLARLLPHLAPEDQDLLLTQFAAMHGETQLKPDPSASPNASQARRHELVDLWMRRLDKGRSPTRSSVDG